MPESGSAQNDDGEAPDGGDKPNLDRSTTARALPSLARLPAPSNNLAPPNSAPNRASSASPNSDIMQQSRPTARDYAYTPPTSAAQASPPRAVNGTHSRPVSNSFARAPSPTAHERRQQVLGGLILPHHSMSTSGGSGSGTATPSSIDSHPDSDQWITSPADSRPPSRAVSATPADYHNESSRPPSRSAASIKGDEHRFNMRDLLGVTPKLGRRSSVKSNASRSSRSSDRASSSGRDESGSLQRKYGQCDRVAIGKGATSVVRLVHKWDRNEEKLYAVKEFRKRRKNETEKEYVKKLTAEFCISSTLHHINVVETVDLVQDDSQHWCEVMEYCPGGDLYSAIKKGGMSTQEIECCFKQLLHGIQYLHSQGVAHRDIKPENLFFDAKGRLKVGDYGASTVYRLPWEKSIHMSTGLCGSEPYIAPEQFSNNPYDARLVDIWACGIVYYCLYFRQLPWHAAQPSDPLYAAYATACATLPHSSTAGSTSATAQAAACPSKTISDLRPRECRSLIRKMLEPDPRSRIQIDEAVAHSWVASVKECTNGLPPNHTHEYAKKTAATNLAGGHVGYVH